MAGPGTNCSQKIFENDYGPKIGDFIIGNKNLILWRLYHGTKLSKNS